MEEINYIIYENIKITDWIKTGAVLLGIPLTIISLYKLFKKDQTHSENIGKLSDLITSQNDINTSLNGQLDELKNHTKELHDKNLFKIDENKMTEKSLKIKIQRYSDETIKKYDELKTYVFQQLKSLKEPIEHQIEEFGKASTSLAEKKNNGFQFTIDPSLRVKNIENLDNEDLFRVFVRHNSQEHEKKIEMYVKLEKAMSFIQYMKENLKTDISSVYTRYQTNEDEWGNAVRSIQTHFESFVNSNIAQNIPANKDGFVKDIDDIFSKWVNQESATLNIRDIYFMRDNYVEPIRIVCNRYTPDQRCEILLPHIVNAEGAYRNIDHLKGMLKDVFDNYSKNLSNSWDSIEEIIEEFTEKKDNE